MSEKSKAEKLAAARKLLKEFQQKVPPKVSEVHENVETKNLNDEFSPQQIEEKCSNDQVSVPVLKEIDATVIFPPNQNCSVISGSNHEFFGNQPSEENGTNFNEASFVAQNPFKNLFQQTQSENKLCENLSYSSDTGIAEKKMDFMMEVQNMQNASFANNTINNSTMIFQNETDASNKIAGQDIYFNNNFNSEFNSQVIKQNFEQNDQNITEVLQYDQTKLLNKNQDLIAENEKLKTELLKSINRTSQNEKKMEDLQEQLKLHMNTIKVLVGEKTELNTQIEKYEGILKDHTTDSEELQGRLRAARHKAADSEKELTQCKKNIKELENEQANLREQNNILQTSLTMSIKKNDDLIEEISELKEKVKVLSSHCKQLENEVAEKCNELSLSNLKIQQISSGENTFIDTNLESLFEENKNLKSRLSILEDSLNKSKNETSQVTQQYKQYCQQLNTQAQSLAANLQEKMEEIEKLSAREKDLMHHMADLEKQLQTVPKVKPVVTKANENLNAELIECKANYLKLEKQCEDLKHMLTQKTSEFQNITEELQKNEMKSKELEEIVENLQADKLDTAKLNAAIESDKIAAARSMAQNAELKQQVEELQKSFIQMSDYKLEITEKLNCEQHLGRELNSQVLKLENELLKLRTVLEAKDEEMIRLQNENTNLSKEIIQQAQLSDRLRHYEAKDNVTDIVQKELQQARDQISILLARNAELENMLANSMGDVKLSNKYEEGYNVAKRLIRENSSESSDVMETIPENDTPVSMYESKTDISKVCVETVPIIATQEAMEKLQERFTKTMTDIAELTEEKQKLEHLVLQLQSETETVGEYIALYQNQRSLLKQREMEKDNQLMKLAHDQEDMKNKLLRLNHLFVQLLKEKTDLNMDLAKENIIQQDDESKDGFNKNSLMISDETTNLINKELLENLPTSNNIKTTDTAKKIINLLSELKDSNLIHPVNGNDCNAFAHHCHCCSGRLLTV